MGYSAEKNIERSYRDARINRIFEGTNEINRMLTVSMILRKAQKGEIDLIGPAKNISKELMSIPDFGNSNGTPFAQEIKIVKNFKKALLLVAGAAAQKFKDKLAHQQEILMNIADMINIIYLCESTLLRVLKTTNNSLSTNFDSQQLMLKVLIYDSCQEMNKFGKNTVYAFSEGDEASMMILGLKRFTKHSGINAIELRRKIAKQIIDANEYCF